MNDDDLRERIRRQYGDGIPARSYRDVGIYTAKPAPKRRNTTPEAPLAAPATGLYTNAPITLRLPWSVLVSDNAKLRAAIRGGKPTVVMTPEYRTARDRIKALAVDAMAGRPAWAEPLRLTARVWVPNHHRRDVVNFSKALHDALNGTVYEDDCWLYEVHWYRAGVDVDAPRCDLTIAPA